MRRKGLPLIRIPAHCKFYKLSRDLLSPRSHLLGGNAKKDKFGPMTGTTSILVGMCIAGHAALRRGTSIPYRGKFDMIPRDRLVNQALQALSLTALAKEAFALHLEFLRTWSERNFGGSSNMESMCQVLRSQGFRNLIVLPRQLSLVSFD